MTCKIAPKVLRKWQRKTRPNFNNSSTRWETSKTSLKTSTTAIKLTFVSLRGAYCPRPWPRGPRRLDDLPRSLLSDTLAQHSSSLITVHTLSQHDTRLQLDRSHTNQKCHYTTLWNISTGIPVTILTVKRLLVQVLHPTQHKTGHFGDALPSQSLN